MSNYTDPNEIALDKIKNILIAFEKKKRNLEKRKNKLDEYKRKADLNDDQQLAVSKYPEVMSNIELLEELTVIASQQLKDAEKLVKKMKKQEKMDRKRSDLQMAEFVLRNYGLLDHFNANEGIKRRLLFEGIMNEKQIELINEFLVKINLSNKGDWKHCSEHLLAIFESSNRVLEITTEEKRNQNEELIKCLNLLASVDWLWIDDSDKTPINFENLDIRSEKSIDDNFNQSKPVNIVEEPIVEEQTPQVHRAQVEYPKVTFIFLHDSMVQKDEGSKVEIESSHSRFAVESEGRSNSESSVGNSNQQWQSSEASSTPINVNDVFSSATQSEFMHSENVWTKNAKMPLNDRFRARPAVPTISKEDQDTEESCWQTGRAGYNNDSRFPRAARGRGRGRSQARFDNRQPANALKSQ